jgi:hypothetical protein
MISETLEIKVESNFLTSCIANMSLDNAKNILVITGQ